MYNISMDIATKIYEFLLWDNCNNNCKFCFQKKNPRLFSIQQQASIIEKVLQFLKDDNFEEQSHIMLAGGEIFDNAQRSFLIPFFDKITNLILEKHINLVYLNTNLIYNADSMKLLMQCLDFFSKKNVLDNLRFTTSYDINGRFKNDDDRLLFLKNIHTLKTKHQNLKIFVNMILTNDLCNNLIQDNFNIFQFMDKHDVFVHLIPFIVNDVEMMPTQNALFETLQHIRQQNNDYFNFFMYDLNIKQTRIMHYFDDGIWHRCECKCNDICGHSINFKKYTNTQNTCFVCDMNTLFNYK